MPIRVRHQGALRTITRLSVRVGGVLRQLKTLKVVDNGTLRTVAVFVPPMSVNVTPTSVQGTATSNRPETVTTSTATATPVGGQAPYTYSWSVTEFGVSNVNPLGSANQFRATLFDDFRSGVATCTVTDALGSTASGTVEYLIQHINLN